jgi:hypothetical protein
VPLHGLEFLEMFLAAVGTAVGAAAVNLAANLK